MNSLAIILITIVVTALLLEAAGWRVPRGARIRRERDEFIAFPYYYEAPSVGKVALAARGCTICDQPASRWRRPIEEAHRM